MSGKYAHKTGKEKDRRKNIRTLKIVAVLAVTVLALLVLFIWLGADIASGEPAQQDVPIQTTGQMRPDSQIAAQTAFDPGDGVTITDMLSYTGAFMEDRTDEVVTDVLAIKVTNSGEKYIQTMDITLSSGETQAKFSLSTLFPGETVIVLEKNRMAYSTAPEFELAETSAVALFDGHPGMCEDKLKIQCLDGVINVTNISGEDISGDILVYYKNYVGGLYYGGITYRLRIEGGLKAGEIRQGTAAHFNPDNSAVVFVTCS